MRRNVGPLALVLIAAVVTAVRAQPGAVGPPAAVDTGVLGDPSPLACRPGPFSGWIGCPDTCDANDRGHACTVELSAWVLDEPSAYEVEGWWHVQLKDGDGWKDDYVYDGRYVAQGLTFRRIELCGRDHMRVQSYGWVRLDNLPPDVHEVVATVRDNACTDCREPTPAPSVIEVRLPPERCLGRSFMPLAVNGEPEAPR